MKTRREFLQAGASLSAATLLGPSLEPASALTGGADQTSKRPNIIVILADDLGYSDLGCYGSEIETPNLDKLAKGGLRFTQFYNNPLCSPSRASLLTGLYPHQAGMAILAHQYGLYPYPAYKGDLSNRCVTIAEALRLGGYQTAMCGKWHLTSVYIPSKHNWPCQRGFDRFYGILLGGGNYFDPPSLCRDNTLIRATGNDYYFTDAIADNAIQYIDEFSRKQDPFFLYMAFTAPHYPLQAPPETIAKYKGSYRMGWDELRFRRRRRMIESGIVKEKWALSSRDSRVPPWDLAPDKEWEMRRMEVYAAQIDRMDQNVGKVISKLEQLHIENATLIFFLSDNGAAGDHEELTNPWPHSFAPMEETRDGQFIHVGNNPSILPGAADTFQSYGIPWGNLSNTPFRYFKWYTHEGGISTPFIVHWPAGVKQTDSMTHQIGHETDILPTCLEIAGITYPSTYQGRQMIPLAGESLTPVFQGKQRNRGPIFWECSGDSAVRHEKWKLVSRFPESWEFYDMEEDRTELHNLADQKSDQMNRMIAMYKDWAKHVGVLPWPLPQTPEYARHPPGTPAYLQRSDVQEGFHKAR